MNLSMINHKYPYLNIPYGMWVWDYILCSHSPLDEMDILLKAYAEAHSDLSYKYWDIYWINREEWMLNDTLGYYSFVIENIKLPIWITSIKSFMYQWLCFVDWIRGQYEKRIK